MSANPKKFTLCFSRNAPEATQKALFDLHSIPVSSCLGTYLGFPLLDKCPSLSTLHEITRKISARLASWKSKLFSKAGPLVLINSTLNSISSYTSSCLRFPKALSSKIDQIIRNFFWGSSNSTTNKLHLVAWKFISAPKSLGGLGIRQNDLANQITQLKLCWKLHSERSLASSFFQAKYQKKDSSSRPFNWGSHIWKNLRKV